MDKNEHTSVFSYMENKYNNIIHFIFIPTEIPHQNLFFLYHTSSLLYWFHKKIRASKPSSLT